MTKVKLTYGLVFCSGLIAKKFVKDFPLPDNICHYPAGVSNSGSQDSNEFDR